MLFRVSRLKTQALWPLSLCNMVLMTQFQLFHITVELLFLQKGELGGEARLSLEKLSTIIKI